MILEPGQGQLHTKPHVRPISCHATSLLWQEPEELNKLLLMKVSGSDQNAKVKNVCCVREVSFWATICKTVRPMLADRCPVLPVCLCVMLVYCGQMVAVADWMCTILKLGVEIGLDPSHIALDGDPAPPPKRGTTPLFSAHIYCGQTVAHLSYCC